MKKILLYLKDYKKETVLAPAFKMLEALLELFVPLVVAAIIDTGIADSDSTYIVKMTGILILLGAVGLVFSVTAQYFAAKAAVGLVKQVRHALFDHIQKLSYKKLDQVGTSTLITRMTSDMNQVQSGVNLTLRLLLRSPFVVIGAMIMAFTISVKAGLVFAIGIPVLAVIVFGIMLCCIPLYRRTQGHLDRVLGQTRETLTGVRVLRAFCKEEEQIEEFHEKNRELYGMQIYVGRISALLNPLTYVIVNVCIIMLIRVGAIQVDGGILQQGQVVALYNYMAQILVELIKLANLIINITRAVACGNRIQSVLEMEPGMEEMPSGQQSEADIPEDAPVLSFDHVSMTYEGASKEALRDVTFHANPGEVIGVIGGTGAGKTSLINLVPRFYDCSGGSVLFHGKNVKNCEQAGLRRNIGVVPQNATLFAGTIRSNLKWGNADATEDEMLDALAIAQASDIVKGKEGGLDAPVEQGGRNLSGGQRQRLTIARALLKKPEILILDDSSSALDYATDAALRRALYGLEQRPVILIVSQRASSVMQADRILVLEHGDVAGMGNHQELLESCEVYREIYYSQFPEKQQGEVTA